MASASTEVSGRGLGRVDTGLYALFSRHADSARHRQDRRRYRAARLETSFDLFIARVYGIAWATSLGAGAVILIGTLALPASVVDTVATFLEAGVPLLNRVALPAPPAPLLALLGAALVGVLTRRLVLLLGSRYLQMAARARRSAIEQTLPGAVRYLRVLASGTNDQRELLRRVSKQPAYGATADALRRALNRASLTGSVDDGLSMVARETPSRNLLGPFLLKFREHAAQGGDSLEGYLKMEGRLLSHRQERVHERASGFLELVAELFVVLLVFPALGVLILTMASVLAPGLSEQVATPLGAVSIRTLLVYACVVLVLAIGAGASFAVAHIRPTDRATPTYSRPEGAGQLLGTAAWNPASAVVVVTPVAVLLGGLLVALGYRLPNVLLLTYAGIGIPVGLVALRRARRDDAKDREIRDFVHAVSGHVSLGRPFPAAVERVADEVDLGALQPDVDDLAFNLGLTVSADEEEDDVRTAALDRFVDTVGTPLAAQTIGLVTGALDAGSDSEDVFETLETEIGRLYHERKSLRSRLLVYVAVGWTTALLIVGIVLAVNATVLDGFAQLSSVADVGSSMSMDPDAVDPARDRFRFYVVVQGTVIASGWFAGVASRGRYEALLHSGLLVLLTYLIFAGTGMA
ncbi:MAG: type II secretion system F family protein [Haloarculaceae archaeon]